MNPLFSARPRLRDDSRQQHPKILCTKVPPVLLRQHAIQVVHDVLGYIQIQLRGRP